MNKIIETFKINKQSGNLVVAGIPFRKGALPAAGRISVRSIPDGKYCRSWSEVRASWPDKSVKWLFLHTIISDKTESIEIINSETNEKSSNDDIKNESVAEVALSENGGINIRFKSGACIVLAHSAQASIVAASCPGNLRLIEDSPLSPLYMYEAIQEGTVGIEMLLRLDIAASSVNAVCRFRLDTSEEVSIEKLLVNVSITSSEQRKSSVSIINEKNRKPCRIAANNPEGTYTAYVADFEQSPADVFGGTSYRQEIKICTGENLTSSTICFDSTYLSSTRVFGPVADLNSHKAVNFAPGLVNGLKILFDKGKEQASHTSEEDLVDGILHDGDWLLNESQYGAKGYRAFADNEYDTPYAYYLAYASTGNRDYLDIALRGSVHMADIDCLCTSGDMLYHGYNEHAENHRTNRVKSGDFGHYWTDGLWLAYMWSGDVFARDAAVRLTDFVISRFNSTSMVDEFSKCERNIGWPLMVAVSALEYGYLSKGGVEFCAEAIDFLFDYSANPDKYYMDPNGPVWWRCAFQDGSKPFMLGVLGEALERYHLLTNDIKAVETLNRISRFIMSQYDPFRIDFEYEYNAYGPLTRGISAQQLIPLFVRTLIAGAASLKDNAMLNAASAALHSCTWCLYDLGTGKDIALMTRGVLPALAMLMVEAEKAACINDNLMEKSTGKTMTGLYGNSENAAHISAEGVATDAGRIELRYIVGDNPEEYLNRQAFFHACDDYPNKSAISIISFYNRIQVRFYDNESVIIDSLDYIAESGFFDTGCKHDFLIEYNAPGLAMLRIDGKEVCRTILSRPLSGAFHYLEIGSKPGNWTVNGKLELFADFK